MMMTDTRYDADLRLFIDGAWQAAEHQQTGPVFNPATGDTITAVPLASVEDLDVALDAADRGLRLWRATPVETRAGILHDAATLMRERANRSPPH